MLLTLTARSLTRLLQGRGRDRLDLMDVPSLTIGQLQLRGLVVDTSLLKGWDLDRLERLRIHADQAGCPCLVLRESFPVSVAPTGRRAEEAMGRLDVVVRAAHRLGCNSVGIVPGAPTGPGWQDTATEFLRSLMDRMDRMEINLLMEPGEGELGDAETLIALIKKVGGFRIGTMPTFANAWDSKDPESTLRSLSPYAGAVLASCGVKGRGEAALTKAVEAVVAIGYEQLLAIDYVGDEDPLPVIEATRRKIESILEGA